MTLSTERNKFKKSFPYYNHQLSSFLHRTTIQDLTALTIDLFNIQMEVGEDSPISEDLKRLSLLTKNGMNSLRTLELYLKEIPHFRHAEIFLNYLRRLNIQITNTEDIMSQDFNVDSVSEKGRKIISASRWFGIWCMQNNIDEPNLYLQIKMETNPVDIISDNLLINEVKSDIQLQEFHSFLSGIALPSEIKWTFRNNNISPGKRH